MGNLWLKIKVGSKITLFVLLVVYLLAFVTENNSEKVKFWYFPTKQAETSVFLLAFYAFLVGVVGFLLVRTTFTTVRQVRDLRDKSRAERMQREMEEMRTKAGLLRSKPLPGQASGDGGSDVA